MPSTCSELKCLVGVEQNSNQPPDVVNFSKSAFLHADVMQRIAAIPCHIFVADIDRSYNVILI